MLVKTTMPETDSLYNVLNCYFDDDRFIEFMVGAFLLSKHNDKKLDLMFFEGLIHVGPTIFDYHANHLLPLPLEERLVEMGWTVLVDDYGDARWRYRL